MCIHIFHTAIIARSRNFDYECYSHIFLLISFINEERFRQPIGSILDEMEGNHIADISDAISILLYIKIFLKFKHKECFKTFFMLLFFSFWNSRSFHLSLDLVPHVLEMASRKGEKYRCNLTVNKPYGRFASPMKKH